MASKAAFSWMEGPFQLIRTPKLDVPEAEWNDYVRGAAEMACVHNVALRMLNSIYLQAPHIPSSGIPAFIQYCKHWYIFLDAHHTGEETHFFPELEKRTGVAGLMATNVQQHEAFHDGLHAYADYITTCESDRANFDAKKLRALIDAFGPALATHLEDEIPTIRALERFDIPLLKMMAEEAEGAMKKLDPWTTIMAFATNNDYEYEGGLHKDFPPLPWVVSVLCRWVWYWPNWRMWRFSTCDRFGRPRELRYLGK